MTDYIRRLVSGPKSRFVDDNHDLDLIYLTDQIIIMGYPATGLEGLYRNHRDDAKRFLDGRHASNYWVFNFCPLRENGYDGTELFGGRVSRFPFPDHHVPPLTLLPIVAREVKTWLDGGKERVAVMHCKAGKGRSGSMACAYLLALEEEFIQAPRLERSFSTKEWAEKRAEDIAEAMPLPEESLESEEEKSAKDKLAQVLDLHTKRRMKTTSSSKGVSIPSQRRWLGYWSQVLASREPPSSFISSPSTPKIRITQIVVHTKDLPFVSSTKLQSNLKVWASLARYDDGFVQFLEGFEEGSRVSNESGHTMGIRRSEGGPDFDEFKKELESGKYDKNKMVRRFATMSGTASVQEKLVTYTLTVDSNQDLTLSSGRELRIKLFMGQVFLAWCWLIPRFHLPETSLVMEKKDLDFAIGLGSMIVDVSVHWELL